MFNLIIRFYYRFLFVLKYNTLKSHKVINENDLYITSSKGNFRINRRCPHQGAYLENALIKDNIVTCHWHGCKIYINVLGEKI